MESNSLPPYLGSYQYAKSKIPVMPEDQRNVMPDFSPAQINWMERRVEELSAYPHPAERKSNDAVIQQMFWISGMTSLVKEIAGNTRVKAMGGA